MYIYIKTPFSYFFETQVPVFVRAEELDLCYAGFCKEVLWPLMHSRALTTAFHIEANAEGQNFHQRSKFSHGMGGGVGVDGIRDNGIGGLSRSRTTTISDISDVTGIDEEDDNTDVLSMNGDASSISTKDAVPILTPTSKWPTRRPLHANSSFDPLNITSHSNSPTSSLLSTTPSSPSPSGTNGLPEATASSSLPTSTASVRLRSAAARSGGQQTDPHQMRDMWMAYVSTNERFAETVREVYEDGDMIWVHGYHLMLAPSIIRKSLPNATIGFNMHIPFPTSEIFRVLPWRREILKGMLDADFIGKYSKRRRSNVAVIIVRILFVGPFLFYCLLLNHSFQTNPNMITNCVKLFSLLQLYNYIAPASLFYFL